MLLDIPHGTKPTSDRMAILLAELQAATATTKERQRGHWINVSSHLWKKILGRNYADVIAETRQVGYIETNDRYSVGKFSKSIRLTAKYRTPQTSQFQLQRRLKGGGNYRVRLAPDDDTGLALAACFDRAQLPQDVAADGWDLFNVRSVATKNYYATRCPYGRYHSNFTGLPKSIRSQIQIDGKRVCEVDVANCQPLLVGILSVTTRKHNNTTPNQHNTQIKPQFKPNTICGAFSDAGGYLELCSKGVLYDYLLEKCGSMTLWDWLPSEYRHQYAANRRLNRSDVKKQFIVMLFAQNETMRRMKLFDIVASEFPSVANYIAEAKRQEYQALARDCQRFESRLMVDSVAAELVQYWPVITIHDSIIAPLSYADHVSDCISQAFNQLGVCVTIKQTEAR